MQQKKNFHRHFATPGLNLYWIIIAYIIVGWFYPVVGLIALICMIGPVMTSIWKGRWWCGHVCPRGNMYDRLLSKYSPHKPIPAFVRKANTGIRAYFRLPPVHGVLYLQHVRHPADIHCSLERGRIGNVGWHRARLLDYYRGDYHCRRYAEFHLCATHMVLVLSNGYHLPLGGS